MTDLQESVSHGKTNTMAIISLAASILSILSLLLSFCIPCGLRFIGLALGAVGAITGFISKKRIDESAGAQTGHKMALSGMILGLIGFAVSLILIVVFTLFVAGTGLLFPFYEDIF
ncbi:MAG: hypothetical protein U9R53_11575 [Chloroflexota bacterium]|nr:hypothetical protein [Chloroflexota bacterium]